MWFAGGKCMLDSLLNTEEVKYGALNKGTSQSHILPHESFSR